MRRKTKRFIANMELLTLEDGAGAPASGLSALELSADGPSPFPARRTAGRDFGLGFGGAFLFHAIAAITVLFLPFVQPPPHCRESLVRVFLTGAENAGQGADAAAATEMTGSGEHPENVPPREIQAPPEGPAAVQTAQRTSTAADREKPVSRAGARRAPHAARRAGASRPEAATVKESASEKTGADADAALDRREGAGNGRETGEAPDRPGQGGPFEAGSGAEFEAARVDRAPQVVRRIEPAYPGRARNRGICGKVVVRFLVEPDGRVTRPSVVEAHPAGYFEQSALEAIRQWRFKPGWFKGRAVSTWVTLPVQFRLIEDD